MSDWDVPEGFAVDETAGWEVAAGIPVDGQGKSLIPELVDRTPDHNESVLISGIPIAMGSTNVQEIWWHWGNDGVYDPKLFVRFLDGSLYSYNGPDASLTLAMDFVSQSSPGRFVWNVLRMIWPVPASKGTGPGTYTEVVKGDRKGKRKPQIVRLINR